MVQSVVVGLLSAEDRRHVAKGTNESARPLIDGDLLVSLLEIRVRPLQRQPEGPSAQRTQVEGAELAADGELPAGKSLVLHQRTANRGNGGRVVKDGQLVVNQRILFKMGLPCKGSGFLRRPQHADHGVDHVAADFEHRTAREPRQVRAGGVADFFAHHRV